MNRFNNNVKFIKLSLENIYTLYKQKNIIKS